MGGGGRHHRQLFREKAFTVGVGGGIIGPRLSLRPRKGAGGWGRRGVKEGGFSTLPSIDFFEGPIKDFVRSNTSPV